MFSRSLKFAVALVAGLALSASAAMADNIALKDASGTTKTTASKTIAGVDYVLHINADAAGALAPAATEAKLEAVRALLAAPLVVTLSGVATAANQTTGNGTLASILTAVQAATPAGNNTIGDVGSASFSATCTVLTLPGAGGTYAVGDLVANNATAGSVTPMSCVLARYSGGPATITKARVLTSTTGITTANFRVHAYTAAPTVTNGNDGVFLSTASGHFCKIDVALDLAFSDGAEGAGTPFNGTSCTRVLTAQTVYLLVEARSAYAWTAAQTLTVTLEGFN